MAVVTPISGRLYDRIGPRWLAAIGLTIVAASTYAIHTMTIDTPREQIIWWLMPLGAGLGMAFMPILTGGMAVLPVAHVNVASAYSNVARQISAALGLSVLIAIATTQQAQLLAGRAALVPAGTPTPDLGPTVPDWTGQYATYLVTEQQVFVGAMDNLFLIAAALSALGALGALLLRSGPAAGGDGSPARQTDGRVDVGVDARPRGKSS